VVVQFLEDFWGTDFMNLPESRTIRQLFEASLQGLRIKGKSKEQLSVLIKELEKAKGFQRIIKLCECLSIIADKKEYEAVSTQQVKAFNNKHKERIDKVYQYTIDYFQESISLNDVASHAGMSVPAFCSYFKKSTKKTYIDFLNEVRIGYACKQLIDTQKSVEDICYESGFNTLANFNKQFLKVKSATPSGYRRNFISSNGVDSL